MVDKAMQAQTMLRLLSSLRQNQFRGRRAPHKPLLVLLALGRLANTGSSRLRWAEAVVELGELIAEFGRPRTLAAARAPRTRSPGCATAKSSEAPR